MVYPFLAGWKDNAVIPFCLIHYDGSPSTRLVGVRAVNMKVVEILIAKRNFLSICLSLVMKILMLNKGPHEMHFT